MKQGLKSEPQVGIEPTTAPFHTVGARGLPSEDLATDTAAAGSTFPNPPRIRFASGNKSATLDSAEWSAIETAARAFLCGKNGTSNQVAILPHKSPAARHFMGAK